MAADLQSYGFDKSYQPLPQTVVAQKQLQQQVKQQTEQQQNALDRKFAQLGGGPSGASIKVSQQLNRDAADKLQGGTLQLYAQDLPIQQQQLEAEKQRQFQSGQQEKQQTFASGEAAKQMAFSSSEAAKQMAFAEKQQKFAEAQAGLTQQNKLKELEMAKQQFDLDRQTTEFNKFISTVALPNNYGGLKSIVEDPNYSDDIRRTALTYINTMPGLGANVRDLAYNADNNQWFHPDDYNLINPTNFNRTSTGGYKALGEIAPVKQRVSTRPGRR